LNKKNIPIYKWIYNIKVIFNAIMTILK
jgi:hypothetical protein